MTSMIDIEPWLTRAHELAASHGRPLNAVDIDHVRFLVDLARHHRFSPATLDAKLYWYVTYNRPPAQHAVQA